ncbi:MAG: hypothetical protein MUD12_14995 [Spirochaetes bacterium]|nr:hypothetical protein [Spirochaetota bacterium]
MQPCRRSGSSALNDAAFQVREPDPVFRKVMRVSEAYLPDDTDSIFPSYPPWEISAPFPSERSLTLNEVAAQQTAAMEMIIKAFRVRFPAVFLQMAGRMAMAHMKRAGPAQGGILSSRKNEYEETAAAAVESIRNRDGISRLSEKRLHPSDLVYKSRADSV